MPVYKKLVSSTNPRFTGRKVEIFTPEGQSSIPVPVPDTVVLCNGCNQNIHPNDGYLIYLGKEELDKDLPYDFYCSSCVNESFPDAISAS